MKNPLPDRIEVYLSIWISSRGSGQKPVVKVAASAEEEASAISKWLGERVSGGIPAGEIAVFVRSESELRRALDAVRDANLDAVDLASAPTGEEDRVSVGIMHQAKGLEFRAVAVAACDDEVIPLQSRIEAIADDADLEEVYNTERHLLYVACTRAREHLLVTGVEPASEFLDDLIPRS
jgi:superfamily I DNA/RNA helicase